MADYSPLPETMSFLIAQVCKLHRQTADELLKEIGLHVGQEMMLCALWDREGVTQTELGERVGVQPATVTNGLRRLERKGLVERLPDADDQRVSRVFPTAEGRQCRGEVEEKWDQLDRTSFTGFTGRERKLLHALLSRVRKNLADNQSRRSATSSSAGTGSSAS